MDNQIRLHGFPGLSGATMFANSILSVGKRVKIVKILFSHRIACTSVSQRTPVKNNAVITIDYRDEWFRTFDCKSLPWQNSNVCFLSTKLECAHAIDSFNWYIVMFTFSSKWLLGLVWTRRPFVRVNVKVMSNFLWRLCCRGQHMSHAIFGRWSFRSACSFNVWFKSYTVRW